MRLDELDRMVERGEKAMDAIVLTRTQVLPVPQSCSLVNPSASFSSVELICGADIKPEPYDWLWKDFLVRGALHMIAGAPGTGKTTLALALAATITIGGRWPDGTRAKPGKVVIWSGEDSTKATLVPRLQACGADMSKIYFVSKVKDATGERRHFDPASDLPLLRENLAEHHPSLLMVDSVASTVRGDSNQNSGVRRSLQPLVDLAEGFNCAALGISHFSKGTAGRDPIERVTGSVAFGAVPRVVLATAKLPDDDGGGWMLVRSKSNIGPGGGGFKYDIKLTEIAALPGMEVIRVLWGEKLEGSAKELLAVAEVDQDEEQRGAMAEATEWLGDLLKEEKDGLDKREIIKLARQNGFAERTIYRARARLGVKVRTTGFGKNKVSHWFNNGSILPILPILPTSKLGNNGNNVEVGKIEAISESEQAELKELVNQVADHNAFTDSERTWALTRAMSDPAEALKSFRALVAEIPTRQREPGDDDEELETAI